MKKYDLIIIGSGPNGLAAGIEVAQRGYKTLIVEGKESIGGGTRTSALTLPGFEHDFCSAVHPTGYVSPFFKTLPLEKFGLNWKFPEVSVAHPLEGQPAVILQKSLEKTADGLGYDAKAWKKIFGHFVKKNEVLFRDTLAPLKIPENPLLLARFGVKAMRSCQSFNKHYFQQERAKALFAGCSAHSILPLDKSFTAAMGLMFAIQAHVVNWPVVEGGTQNLSKALGDYFKALDGEIQVDTPVKTLKELPGAKAYLFNTDPKQLAEIASDHLSENYKKRLLKYNYGPGIFKLDWALSGSIPWTDKNCLKASTVHVGGTADEIAASEKAAWEGKHSPKPFLILCQQSEFDPSRAPEGQQTGYAYCHVPYGSTEDMTEAIENQVERFAPGFKQLIMARKKTNTQEFAAYNPNYVGGAITGGATDITQLFTRPVARLDPYKTSNPRIFIGSASTPPGGGVHGMCGYYAAKSVLKFLKKK